MGRITSDNIFIYELNITDSGFGACQLKCVSFLFPLVFKGCSVDGADRYSGHF